MSLFQGEMLPYTRIDAGKIQVKNGGGDSPDDWAETSDIAIKMGANHFYLQGFFP